MIPPEVLAGDRQALPPTRDRLLTTTFLVASLHALVILGVTFTPPMLGCAAANAAISLSYTSVFLAPAPMSPGAR